jgi:hypothetical protein
MKYLMTFETMIHNKTLNQMKKISDQMGDIDVGKRVSDDSFANALKDTKRSIVQTHIQTYQDYMNEPFTVNQNIMPWDKRKKKK